MSAVANLSTAVAVRELCEFAAKRGDLDRRFTPAPSAAQGMAGHGRVAGRRAGDYQREIALEGAVGGLRIRGRADGYDPQLHRLEEIKTHRGDVARIPDNHRHLHWAQLKVYGALFGAARGCPDIELALVYFNIDDEAETLLAESHTAAALHDFVEALAADYLAWAAQEAAHRTRRNAAIDQLRFPHADFNHGQRSLANAVFRAAKHRQPLLIQAPTGIGKTVGTLFPALKAMAHAPIDKLYFLTAKSPGRQVALDALALIRPADGEPALRVLELLSREKSCVHPEKRCNGESCPLAKGFYDRLPQARAAAVSVSPLTGDRLRQLAARHSVCPYYLGQEMVRWADVVVGDYNYYFDGSAILSALQMLNEWQVTVLVDEAHNLVERARDMYSLTLDEDALRAAIAVAPGTLKAALRRIGKALADLGNSTAFADDTRYRVLTTLPDALTATLSAFISDASRLLAESRDEFAAELQQFYFTAIGYTRLIDVFGPHSLIDVTLDGPERLTVCLRNIVPAPFLKPRLEAAHGAVLFSATLNPPGYYRDLLGLPEAAPWLDLPSPFAAEQLRVQLALDVSTRFDRREASFAPIARLIASQYAAQPGNYLAFFSSFDYLESTLAALRATAPRLPVWAQARRMDEAARTAFLDRFAASGTGIGFAVLGGVFSEGIDLPGQRLIGAFVVTLGIPQVNPVNEEMARRMEALFGAGYAYTYLYPGLRKVVQAAGRVIRHRDDRGVVVLIDPRYARPEVQALLPAWWEIG
ncbi:ATP-dependent DNA helicase [Nevskia sp.]|uniref:ATP-dependent DNA helicase n=1 Tax=Nevskia sp. TaxID=1929292 RepID=UPI0025CF1C59|nr:ATP-dependent DNA helicase [Nevskia sp.]